MYTSPRYRATEPFFQPMEEIYGTPRWDTFQDHYGADATKQQIIDNVYGGAALDSLFSDFQLETNERDLENLAATLRLLSTDQKSPSLTLENVSLRQFLIAGLPSIDYLPWNGRDNWDALDPQYRLELCHSEVCRWSIFLKRHGTVADGIVAHGHERFSDIELVNNCTTTDGFEFRVVRDGQTYHGSFGAKRNQLEYLYRRLSQWQAGSVAHQSRSIEGAGPSFFGYYFNPIPTNSSGQLDPEFRRDIDLNRYRESIVSETILPIIINRGIIDYERWGPDAEYNTKPNTRRLLAAFNGVNAPNPPATYAEIETSSSIAFPNFQHTGIYDLSHLVTKTTLPSLYGLNECVLRRLADSRVEIELRRNGVAGQYDLRRIVVGNIDLNEIPVYPSFWTLHRFGYGARDTVMNYNEAFRPPSEPLEISHYGYQLGGEGTPDSATNYICPEGFGVERAILSWSCSARSQLVVDLISFERILPLWQGTIDIGSTSDQLIA